jgi:hypothetical protein
MTAEEQRRPVHLDNAEDLLIKPQRAIKIANRESDMRQAMRLNHRSSILAQS